MAMNDSGKSSSFVYKCQRINHADVRPPSTPQRLAYERPHTPSSLHRLEPNEMGGSTTHGDVGGIISALFTAHYLYLSPAIISSELAIFLIQLLESETTRCRENLRDVHELLQRTRREAQPEAELA